MAAKKRATQPAEANLGTPDTSKQPEVKASVKSPSSLVSQVEYVIKEVRGLTEHEHFPKEMKYDLDQLVLKLTVVKFKAAAL